MLTPPHPPRPLRGPRWSAEMCRKSSHLTPVCSTNRCYQVGFIEVWNREDMQKGSFIITLVCISFFFFFFSNIWPHFALCTHGSLNLGAKNRRKLNYITLLSEFMFSTTLTSLSSAACCLSRCSLPSNTPSPCSTAYFRFQICVCEYTEARVCKFICTFMFYPFTISLSAARS